MRKFKIGFSGEVVDLDNPKTYRFLPDDVSKLDDIMFKEIGQALVYMDYFHPDVFPKNKRKPKMVRYCDMSPNWKSKKKVDLNNSGYYQRQRVYKLIEKFTKERKNRWKDKMWFKEQVFLFGEETDNMC